nr:deoxyguanosinetriphosphate triphosphohydrolase [Actinomyces culturomici]
MVPVYSEADQARRTPESAKSAMRTAFERDRARILHSSALRRLGEKTQVLGPASNDFVRTRLTHSLEVAQVGRELGKELGANPDVVDAACLSHALGPPPFGHNGERVLDELAADCGGFEGNAQPLRLVSRLEPKVLAPDGDPAGLNLTRATLDAICKYPWAKGAGPDPVKSARKYSVYADDLPVFAWMREGAPAGRRCLEAQIMDLSDDIAYSVHDVEDAIATGKCRVESLGDDAVASAVIDSTIDWYGRGVARADLENALERLLALDVSIGGFDGSYASLARLKDLTSELIGRFCGAAVTATRVEFGAGALGRYRADLVVPPSTRAEIQVLKGLAVHFVMSPRENEPVYYQQRTLLADLVDALLDAGPAALEPMFAAAWRIAEDEAGRVRAVVDQVASLTDASASKWHARLCGMLSTQL